MTLNDALSIKELIKGGCTPSDAKSSIMECSVYKYLEDSGLSSEEALKQVQSLSDIKLREKYFKIIRKRGGGHFQY